MSGPLDGIRVIDCGHWIQGAGAGAILGDLGADLKTTILKHFWAGIC